MDARFTLSFNTDNAAFEGNIYEECTRILRKVVYRIDAGETNGRIRDTNGNTVGTWELSKEGR